MSSASNGPPLATPPNYARPPFQPQVKGDPRLVAEKAKETKAETADRKGKQAVRDIRTCNRCGGEFHRKPSCMPHRFAKQRFCSQECSRLAERDRCQARRALVVKGCVRCNAPIPTTAKPSGTARRRYCSHACAVKRPEKHDVCPLCGKTRRVKFLTCGRGCGYVFRKLRTRKSKPCVLCGVAFWPKKQKRKYCSDRCFRKHNPTFRGGPIHERNYRGPGWLKLAEAVRLRDGHVCRRCNKTQKENGQRLSVDHIIPWRSFENKEEANAMSNLTSLCRRCHAIKTTTAEAEWLRGDRIGMQQYRAAVA